MALSGVMTRMPRVCISIVASAFQYGCAPTLMPLTTMLISPPACVNRTIRGSALVERAQGLGRRVAHLHDHVAPGRAEEAEDAVALAAVLAHARPELHELEPELAADARVAGDD